MSTHCPGPSQPNRNIDLSRIINFYTNKNNQTIIDGFARENIFYKQQILCDLYICFSQKHYRISLLLKKEIDLLMEIMKRLMQLERGYKYKYRLRIISDTDVATTASCEDNDNE